MKIKQIEYKNGIVIFLIYSIYYLFSLAFDFNESYKIFSIFVYLQLFYTLLSWKKIVQTYFDSYLLFTIALYAFSLGHSFLDLFGAVEEKFSLIKSWNISPAKYLYAEYLSLILLLSFHFGAIHSCKNVNLEKSKGNIGNIVYALKIVGVLGTMFSFPFFIYSLYIDVNTIVTQGYMGLYDSENLEYGSASYYRLLADIFVPSVICLLLYAELTKQKRFWTYGFAIFFICLPPLFIGNRTNAVIMCAIMFLVYSLFNKISYKRFLLWGVIGYFSVFLLVLVRNARSGVEKVPFTESFVMSGETDNNPFTSLLSEMGWSMYPIVKTIKIKGEIGEQYLYGNSFLWSVTTIMPNLFWEKHPAKVHADMSNWLTQKLGFSFGIGFSLLAEMYANFGVFGFLPMYLLGYMFVKLFRYSTPIHCMKNLVLTTVSIIFLWFIIRIVRNSFLDTVRFLFYYVLPFYVFLMHFSRKNKYANNNLEPV